MKKVRLPIPVGPWPNILNQSWCEQKHLPMFLPKFIQMAASVFFKFKAELTWKFMP